jgi:hypothetical protein
MLAPMLQRDRDACDNDPGFARNPAQSVQGPGISDRNQNAFLGHAIISDVPKSPSEEEGMDLSRDTCVAAHITKNARAIKPDAQDADCQLTAILVNFLWILPM